MTSGFGGPSKEHGRPAAATAMEVLRSMSESSPAASKLKKPGEQEAVRAGMTKYLTQLTEECRSCFVVQVAARSCPSNQLAP